MPKFFCGACSFQKDDIAQITEHRVKCHLPLIIYINKACWKCGSIHGPVCKEVTTEPSEETKKQIIKAEIIKFINHLTTALQYSIQTILKFMDKISNDTPKFKPRNTPAVPQIGNIYIQGQLLTQSTLNKLLYAPNIFKFHKKRGTNLLKELQAKTGNFIQEYHYHHTHSPIHLFILGNSRALALASTTLDLITTSAVPSHNLTQIQIQLIQAPQYSFVFLIDPICSVTKLSFNTKGFKDLITFDKHPNDTLQIIQHLSQIKKSHSLQNLKLIIPEVKSVSLIKYNLTRRQKKGRFLNQNEKQRLAQMQPLLDDFIEDLNIQIQDLNSPYPTPKWPCFSTNDGNHPDYCSARAMTNVLVEFIQRNR